MEEDESVLVCSIIKLFLSSLMGDKQFSNGNVGKLTPALNSRLLPSLAPLPRPAIDLPKIATIVGGTGVELFHFMLFPTLSNYQNCNHV